MLRYMVSFGGVLLLLAVVTAACRSAEPTAIPTAIPTATPRATPAPGAKAELVNAQGTKVGTVTLTQETGEVLVQVAVQNLPAGFHGFHVHGTGTCTAPDFTSAGGHLNPAGQSHPQHAADLPVLLVNTDGNGSATVKTDRFAISDLFDSDGSAFIVHASPDNYANIPTRYAVADDSTLKTGDAGARLACGVIRK